MHIAYLVVTVLTAFANGYAAILNFVGAESVKIVAHQVQVSQRWMIPFRVLLASGALGAHDRIGRTTNRHCRSLGLVAYFICALSTHIRAHDRNVGGAITFLLLAVAALVVGVEYHY